MSGSDFEAVEGHFSFRRLVLVFEFDESYVVSVRDQPHFLETGEPGEKIVNIRNSYRFDDVDKVSFIYHV